MRKPDVFEASSILFEETPDVKEASSNQKDSNWIIEQETLLSWIEMFLIEEANLVL
ncbi:MAG: hypothetical protein KAZ87_03790 [Spirochaetes bacterium]|nr:hypothetical protein [Spirochaetota bacterium]